MFLTMAPALTLATAFGGVAGLMTVSNLNPPGLNVLYQWPLWSWIVMAVVMDRSSLPDSYRLTFYFL